MLTFLEDAPKKRSRPMGKYRCECGNEVIVEKLKVRTLHTRSCGCIWFKNFTQSSITHGLSSHPLHRRWSSMKQRCYDPNTTCYKYYGGRGVRVCDEWIDNFKAFYDWAIANGWKKGLHLDKDKKGGMLYSPETCCFVTRRENNNLKRNNRRITINGETKTLSEWMRYFKIARATVNSRVALGWPIDEALMRPVRKNKKNKV